MGMETDGVQRDKGTGRQEQDGEKGDPRQQEQESLEAAGQQEQDGEKGDPRQQESLEAAGKREQDGEKGDPRQQESLEAAGKREQDGENRFSRQQGQERLEAAGQQGPAVQGSVGDGNDGQGKAVPENVVLCGASSYEQKYYLNRDFCRLPEEVKKELQILCVLFTEDVGGVLTLEFTPEGRLEFKVRVGDGDLLFDEIGSGLKIRQYQREKRELLKGLEIFYQVFFLGRDVKDLEAEMEGRSWEERQAGPGAQQAGSSGEAQEKGQEDRQDRAKRLEESGGRES